jgi:small subunit ribosomal protein S2
MKVAEVQQYVGRKGAQMSVSMKEMLEAGVHFGHQRSRWNPKMAPFIFTERGGVHIFDLAKTEDCLLEADKFVRTIASNNGKVLFVGTKKQAQMLVKEAAESCSMPYVCERWLGGMLTNFGTVLAQVRNLKKLDERIATNDFATKKQLTVAKKQAEKLAIVLGGIKDLKKVPDAIFVVDAVKESNAITEARKLGIPVIAITDTNANPDMIDFVIPGNDDAVKAIKLILDEIAAVISANLPIAPKEQDVQAN